MGRGGAPDKLTSDRFNIIVDSARKGLPWKYMAWLAGIDYETLLNWRKRGEKDTEGKFFELIGAIKKANAEWVREKMRRIDKAGENGTWTADMTQLERFDPENFGTRTKHEISGEKGAPLEVKIIFDE